METSGKVGVTTFVLRNKEGLAILKPYKNVIVLNRIPFHIGNKRNNRAKITTHIKS